jgi:hypothetical protein
MHLSPTILSRVPKYLLLCAVALLLLASCASPERSAERDRKRIEKYERERLAAAEFF